MLQESAEDGMRAGADGVLDDVLALVGDLGFDLSEVKAPVRLLYPANDTAVPTGHRAWLHRHLGASQLDLVSGGHLGGGGERERCDHELELLDWAAGQELAP